jgi:hypothetical protein
MDDETELYDVDSPEFFEAWAKIWQRTVDDDRRLGLLKQQERQGEAA